jgi:hypothetical protein
MSVAARFHTKYQRGEASECWEWLAARTGTGYGNFYAGTVEGRKVNRPAHRVAYELALGPIPEGLVLDHLCRNRACVNPAHLEPVTNAENLRRGARGRLVTHCPQGHELSGDNLRPRNDGRRGCAACLRERNAHKPNACECGAPIKRRSARCVACHLAAVAAARRAA